MATSRKDQLRKLKEEVEELREENEELHDRLDRILDLVAPGGEEEREAEDDQGDED